MRNLTPGRPRATLPLAEPLRPTLFHLVGISVEWMNTSGYSAFIHPFTSCRTPIEKSIIVVRPEDKIVFRTGGGRKLPPGEYVVSVFRKEYFATKIS